MTGLDRFFRQTGHADGRPTRALGRKRPKLPGWWTDFDDEVLQDRRRLDTHLAYEADAAVERVYTLPFVPALLQTDAYAEAVYRDMERRPEDQIGQLVDIRRKRKEALKGAKDSIR